MSESSLDMGVVHLRDRETCWYEEVHAAHLASRLARAFGKGQQGQEEEDSLEKVERQLREEGKLPAKRKKKKKHSGSEEDDAKKDESAGVNGKKKRQDKEKHSGSSSEERKKKVPSRKLK